MFLNTFTAHELLTSMNMATGAGCEFFHLRGLDGQLYYCDYSPCKSRFFAIAFRKQTELGWETARGIMEIKAAQRALRRRLKDNGTIFYSEWVDRHDYSWGCLHLGEEPIYRETRSFLLEDLPRRKRLEQLERSRDIPLDILFLHNSEKTSFTVYANKIRDVLFNTVGDIVLFSGSYHRIEIQPVANYFYEKKLYRSRSLAVINGTPFSNFAYDKNLLLPFLRKLSGEITVTFNNHQVFGIDFQHPEIGQISFRLAPYLLDCLEQTFNGEAVKPWIKRDEL